MSIFEFPFRLGEQTPFLHSVRTFQTDVPDLLSMRGHEGPYFSRGPLELCGVFPEQVQMIGPTGGAQCCATIARPRSARGLTHILSAFH